MQTPAQVFGKACEEAWLNWLRSQGRHTVMRFSEATGNHRHTGAPLIDLPNGEKVTAPDFGLLTAKGDGTHIQEYHEVKGRTGVYRNPHSGEDEHGMPFARFRDYKRLQNLSGAPVVIVLYETSIGTAPPRWLRADLSTLDVHGRRTSDWFGEGEGFLWPVSCMETVENAPVVPLEPAPPVVSGHHPEDKLRAHVVSLGMSRSPLYSVFRAGPVTQQVLDAAEAFLHHGIRVFLASSDPADPVEQRPSLKVFAEHRLLEYEKGVAVASIPAPATWCIDGELDSANQRWLEAADAETKGGINARQYHIVHASPEQHVEVQAGAGTGKTETMVERILFLLSTSRHTRKVEGRTHPYTLRPDDITMVTFTRDAAKQMRDRLARQLAVRCRLCAEAIHPVLAWMGGVASMSISTIHSFAQDNLRRNGAAIGIHPGFAVTQLTMERRRIIERELSNVLQRAKNPHKYPFYQWRQLVETALEKLGNQGVRVLDVGPSVPATEFDWRATPGNDVGVHRVLHDTIHAVRRPLAELCRDRHGYGTNDLAPLAVAALTSSKPADKGATVRGTRYLFIDEFQDTDPLQMDLFLAFARLHGTRLFYVGDQKQGIYRFRGAGDNAFKQMRKRHTSLGERRHDTPFVLTRNFRSGKSLLDSLDAPFRTWGASSFGEHQALAYIDTDRLRAATHGATSQRYEVKTITGFNPGARQRAIRQTLIREISKARDTCTSIAVLCRENWQARKVKEWLESARIPCETVTGGDFYQSEVVRDFQVFLAALVDPDDDVAVLQALESHWGPGLWWQAQGETGDAHKVQSWQDRVRAKLEHQPIDDLEPVRAHLRRLYADSRTAPVLALLFRCMLQLAPASTVTRQDEVVQQEAQARYQRGLDHLFATLVETMGDGSFSLAALLEWLRLQIATNQNMDLPSTTEEPVAGEPLARTARVIAITVHRAKGQEYDCVFVPFTTDEFIRDRKGSDPARNLDMVVDDSDNVSKVWWRLDRAAAHSTEKDCPWDDQDNQTRCEETRLLYVAMTRAKAWLTVYLARESGGEPNSWSDLLHVVQGGR